MLTIQCQCGRRQTLSDSSLGQAVACETCGRLLRPVAPGIPGIPGASAQDRFDSKARLVITAGPERVGEQILLGGPGPFPIGKLPDQAITLVGPRVSRMHAVLTLTASGWRIEDRGSTNGLVVNGNRVKDADLHGGDRIQVGDYLLQLTIPTPRVVVVTKKQPVAAAVAATPQTVVKAAAKAEEPEFDLYALATVESKAAPIPTPSGPGLTPITVPVAVPRPAGERGGLTCPSCRRVLPAGAKICVPCGINIETGKPLLTAQRGDLNQLYANTESIIRLVSIFATFGVIPISSEARGGHKPYAIRGIALVTIIISFWFLAYVWAGSTSMRSLKLLLLWGAGDNPTPEMIEMGYTQTNYGDYQAYMIRCEQLRAQKVPENDIPMRAYAELTPEQKCFGEFRWWQLFTHAFLHAGIFHLVGNLVFLLVIGSRVNALIGNVATLILYPILGVAAALLQLFFVTPGHPLALLGASGAIMGLAGMYLILFPIYKMHTVGWFWILGLVRLWYQMWETPGYAILLFYISFDVIDTLLGTGQGVAHWAHIGGFGAGMIVASALLFSRAINANGGDLFSVALGRRAWPLVGSPNEWNQIGEGWLQRLDFGFGRRPALTPPIAPAAVGIGPMPGQTFSSAAATPNLATSPRPSARTISSNPDEARRLRDERAGDRALFIAKWFWPVPLVLIFLVYHFWPEPAVISTPGALVKKGPVQTSISGGKWWHYNGATITPLADITVDSMVLSKASYQDELAPVSKWNLVLGWGAMSDPTVVGNTRIIQDSSTRGMQFMMYQAPDVPEASLKAEVDLVIAIPATDQVLHQIEALSPRDVVTIHGKLVSVEMSGGTLLVSNLRRGYAFYGTPDVMWIESITPVGGGAAAASSNSSPAAPSN